MSRMNDGLRHFYLKSIYLAVLGMGPDPLKFNSDELSGCYVSLMSQSTYKPPVCEAKAASIQAPFFLGVMPG